MMASNPSQLELICLAYIRQGQKNFQSGRMIEKVIDFDAIFVEHKRF